MMGTLGNFNDLIGGLTALQRRAKLTGQSISTSDILNVQEPYFAAYREYAPYKIAAEQSEKENALAEESNQLYKQSLTQQKEQYEAELAEAKRQADQSYAQAEDAYKQQATTGYISSGVGALGTGLSAYNLLKGSGTKAATDAATESPGLLSKAYTGVKNLVTNPTETISGVVDKGTDLASGAYNKVSDIASGAYNKVADLLGTEAALQAGEGSAAAGTAAGANATADALATTTGELATDAGIDTSAEILGQAAGEEAASTLGSSLGSIVGGVGTAVPYYALAKLGGLAINSITDNNPWMKETPLGLLGQTLDEPLAVEQALGKALSDHGVGNEAMWEAMNNANPLEVGGWLTDTTDKLTSVLTGGATGMTEFTTEALKEIGLDESDAETITDIATGGVSYVVRQVFCFAAGTPITMEDGTKKPIEDVAIFDKCDKGGMVDGTGVVLSYDVYDYKGVKVTGSHAVYEDDKWIRVQDSPIAVPIKLDEPIKTYIVNNENHILMVGDIRFADYGEVTDSEGMTADERLAYLNENCRV